MAKAKRNAKSVTRDESSAAWSRFFLETKMEMRKVIWPTRGQLIHYTVATIVSVVLVSFLIIAVDFVFMGLSKLLVQTMG